MANPAKYMPVNTLRRRCHEANGFAGNTTLKGIGLESL
jgi:hypothetical protein